MAETTLLLDGTRRIRLDDYLTAHAAESAERDGNGWIKQLRLARVDGQTLRDRFTYRGDSLWWFAELYLHKQQTVARAFRAVAAVTRLIEQEQPRSLSLVTGDRVTAVAAAATAARLGIDFSAVRSVRSGRAATKLHLRSVGYAGAAAASRFTPRRPRRSRADVAAFVHAAFWRARGGDDPLARDAYIGPVLRELARTTSVALVGVGPARNFRARRWWDPILRRQAGDDEVTPIEAYAPWDALASSYGVWLSRRDVARALLASGDLRDAAIVDGCDLWPLVREDLIGVALLQFPWSARAMDEAGAALDRLEPGAIVTYAEAGGWGRALMLEARRRGIASVGVQHGFIYRHWLNYLHQPDEMAPSSVNPADRGFPIPTMSLLFDEYAAEHLRRRGHFPEHAVAVTGSPGLETLVESVRACSAERREHTRQALGAQSAQHVVVVASKHAQIGAAFASLVEAVASTPEILLVVKPHPAETAAPYERDAAGTPNVTVSGPDAPLAELLAIARGIVTVNSTVALDALVLGIPSVVLEEPNNLSPFVEARVMVAVRGRDPTTIAAALRGVTSDEGMRERLRDAAATFTARYRIDPDGRAAERAAEEIVRLVSASSRAGQSGRHPADLDPAPRRVVE